jgi:hypothetical protein
VISDTASDVDDVTALPSGCSCSQPDSHQRMADGLGAFFSPGHLWIETSLSRSDYFKRFGSFRSAINPRQDFIVVARSGHGFRA